MKSSIRQMIGVSKKKLRLCTNYNIVLKLTLKEKCISDSTYQYLM